MKKLAFQDTLKTNIQSVFPNCLVDFKNGCLGNSFCLNVYLIGSIDDTPNSIRMNDPLKLSIWFHSSFDTDDQLHDVIVAESDHASLGGLQPINPHYAQSSMRLGYRKVTGTPVKVLASLSKFTLKVANVVNDNHENLIAPLASKYMPIRLA